MIQRIKSWYDNGCPYYEGVSIYRYTGGPYAHQLFESYLAAPYVPQDTKARLLEAIAIYYQKHKSDTAAAVTSRSAESPLTPHPSPLTPVSEPQSIQNLRSQAKPLHKLQSFLHFKLCAADTDEARYDFAEQIMEDVIPHLDKIYDRVRQWEATGEEPSENSTVNIVRQTLQKKAELDSLNSRLSRLKGLLNKKLDAATKKKYEKEQIEKALRAEGLKNELGI